MTTVAYIANEFPAAIETYVKDEISELRRRGVRVIPCSGKRVSCHGLNREDRAFWDETLYLQPLSDRELIDAVRRLALRRGASWPCLEAILRESGPSPAKYLRALGHTVMGAALADNLASLDVQHIHAHHGYFASWMALVASQLLGIGFSFTLHGSDLLLRADLLETKLRLCRFCVTVSDYNRNYILAHYPSVPADKVIVQRLGVDRVFPSPDRYGDGKRFCLLSVGRLNRVKNHEFLIEGCAALRERGVDLFCWIAGEGPERARLQRQIETRRLQGRVQLVGHVDHEKLDSYYRHADLVVMTSHSEGIPVVLMEAMARSKLLLAPAITGIPELVEHQRTGFLYESGSMPDFLHWARWIEDNRRCLSGVGRAAAAFVGCSYNRQRNVRKFAEQFLTRIPRSKPDYAYSLLQQVRLPV